MTAWERKLEEAHNFLDAALSEFEEARASGDGKKAQDACAKVWLAVVRAAEALFLKRGLTEGELPKTYRGQRFLVAKFGDRRMRRLFHLLRDIFHIDGYYDGLVDWERLPEQIEDVREFLRLVEGA